MALPYTDQAPLYNLFNFSDNGSSNTSNLPGMGSFYNSPLQLRSIPAFMCPSNPQTPTVYCDVCAAGGGTPSTAQNAWINSGRTDYVGNMGFIYGDWRNCNIVPVPNNGTTGKEVPGQSMWTSMYDHAYLCNEDGVFSLMGTAKIRDITDGTSNTIMIFEDCHFSGGPNFPSNVTGDAAWASPMAIASTAVLVNQLYSANGTGGTIGGYDSHKCHGPSSVHAGGCHVLLCDGSVRFISNQIAVLTLQAISTRSAGETVGDY